jgi:hypothetical protein
VLLRYNETMPVVSRIDVHESERVVVLQEFESWHLPDDDFAENAVVIPFHRSSLPTKRWSLNPSPVGGFFEEQLARPAGSINGAGANEIRRRLG